MVGESKAVLPGSLSGYPGLGLWTAHAAVPGQPLHLYVGRAVDHDDHVEAIALTGLDQQRDVMDDNGIVARPGLHLGSFCAYPRVDDGLQLLPGGGIVEDTARHSAAVQATCSVDGSGAEDNEDLRQARGARRHHLTGEAVGVDDDRAVAGQDGAHA